MYESTKGGIKMKKQNKKLLCLMISLIIPLGVFCACVNPQPNDQTTNESTTQIGETIKPENNETTSDETSPKPSDSETQVPSIENIENGNSIEYANNIANAVQAYYYNNRAHMAVSNNEMEYVYSLKNAGSYTVESIKNSQGKAYIENTADTFIRMTNGMTYYSSLSNTSPATNITRLGYYFYEVQYKGQNFGGEINTTDKEISIPLTSLSYNQMKSKRDGGLVITDISDPFILAGDIIADTAKYNYLQLEMMIDATDLDVNSVTVTVFVDSGSNGFDGARTIKFQAYTDGEYHTYLIPISLVSGYEGNLNRVRIDFNAPLRVKDTIYVKEMSILPIDDSFMPIKASVSRQFFVYSDKMHHLAQFVTTADIHNVAEIGMLTKIDANTVDKLIIKDANGEHDNLADVDWSSVEAVGFDIAEAGIFGYILPDHEAAGGIKVTLVDNTYVIEQTRVPNNNTLIPSVPNTGNANDIYLGQRIYTDESHSFEEFLYETYCERNPITDKRLRISDQNSSKSRFNGYDPLRGIYDLELLASSSGWAVQFAGGQFNQHLNINFAVRGDDINRRIYVMCRSGKEALESGALLNDSNMLLPIPLQLTKNFSEGNSNSNERDIFDYDDKVFSEAIFPLDLKKDQKISFNVIMANEFWGNYPLKQLSSVRFGHPYYHLSTGVNESNCITPWNDPTLPDHRAMSSPFTHDSTQHTSGGHHSWLQFTNKKGNTITTENVNNTIMSSGNTYAEVFMDYVSTDGSIEVTYSHMEFPSRDETRTFYTMEYKVIKDISFMDFKSEFQFFSMTDNHAGYGTYHNIGYLDKNNEYATADALFAEGKSQSFTLGDNCPYFSYYNMNGIYDAVSNPTGYEPHDGDGYVNIAFLVYNYEFTINGNKVTPNFIITEKDHTIYLSLDLGETTLKAGDTFCINSVLLPWGSQELDGTYDTYKDKNVRDVREKTLLNPLTATPVADCEVIESVFVPKVRTTNGKSAEFTLSGGQDNVAVRVYGFDMLTAPKLYELINEEWIPVDLYSANNPDKKGNAHYYDGYAVYYDGDGTFSYSFVTKMDNGKPRIFKLEACDQFNRWPEIPTPEKISPFNSFFNASDLDFKLQLDNPSRVTYALADDESYVSIFGTSEYIETGASE